MQSPYVIGIDIGTGSTKAVALDKGGEVVWSAQQFYASSEETEQAFEPVFDAFRQCIAGIVRALRQPPVAVALSSAMHSVMLIDAAGVPLTNAILWSDTRSTDIARHLRQSAVGEAIYLATGTPLHSMSPLCKIRWFQQHEPALFAAAAKFISIKEAIWYQLFGEFVVDHSLASATGLFNILQRHWDATALSFAGISPQQLSTPVPVWYQKTGMSVQMAASMQLPADTPFIIGSSDGCMANLGSLCLSPHEAAITIGTSAAVRVTSRKPVPNPERMIFNYLLNEDTFVCGGAINNGGNVFLWLMKNLLAKHEEIKSFGQLFDTMATIPAGSEGLLFLPYLHGERAPIWDENSTGVYIGVHSRHTTPHFARAAAEGVCFALYHVLSSLEEVCGEVDQITVSGGLVQSAVMLQMLADVTGKKLVVQQREDASALGAAFLAQKTIGMLTGYEAIARKETDMFVPHAGNTRQYHRLFTLYQSLYPLLKNAMHQLHPSSTF